MDLDVLVRNDLLNFLKEETGKIKYHRYHIIIKEKNYSTIIYATHIFDGLNYWPTHLAYLKDGK